MATYTNEDEFLKINFDNEYPPHVTIPEGFNFNKFRPWLGKLAKLETIYLTAPRPNETYYDPETGKKVKFHAGNWDIIRKPSTEEENIYDAIVTWRNENKELLAAIRYKRLAEITGKEPELQTKAPEPPVPKITSHYITSERDENIQEQLLRFDTRGNGWGVDRYIGRNYSPGYDKASANLGMNPFMWPKRGGLYAGGSKAGYWNSLTHYGVNWGNNVAALYTVAIPALGAGVWAYATIPEFAGAVNLFGMYQGIDHLSGEDGWRKTVDYYNEGKYKEMIGSGLGDLTDLATVVLSGIPAIKNLRGGAKAFNNAFMESYAANHPEVVEEVMESIYPSVIDITYEDLSAARAALEAAAAEGTTSTVPALIPRTTPAPLATTSLIPKTSFPITQSSYLAAVPTMEMVRLYRANPVNATFDVRSAANGAELELYAGLWFSTTPSKGAWYAHNYMGGRNPYKSIDLLYVDIPKSLVEQYRASNIVPEGWDIEADEDFIIPLNIERNTIPFLENVEKRPLFTITLRKWNELVAGLPEISSPITLVNKSTEFPLLTGETSNVPEDIMLINRGKSAYEFQDGKLIWTPLETPSGGLRVTNHFTLDRPVGSNMGGNWDLAEHTLIVPYKHAVNLNGYPLSIEPMDTYFGGLGKFHLDLNQVKILTSDPVAYQKYIEEGVNAEFSLESNEIIKAVLALKLQLLEILKGRNYWELPYEESSEYYALQRLIEELGQKNLEIVLNWTEANGRRPTIEDMELIAQESGLTNTSKVNNDVGYFKNINYHTAPPMHTNDFPFVLESMNPSPIWTVNNLELNLFLNSPTRKKLFETLAEQYPELFGASRNGSTEMKLSIASPSAERMLDKIAAIKKEILDAIKTYRINRLIKPNYNKGELRWLEMDRIELSRRNLGGNNYYHGAQTDHTKVRGGTSTSNAILGSPHLGSGGGTYMSYGTVWPEHYLAGTVIEFPRETFGDLKATNHLGTIRDESVVDMGDLVFRYKFNPLTTNDFSVYPMRPHSSYVELEPGESVQTFILNGEPREWVVSMGRSDLPLTSAGDLQVYDKYPIYLDIYKGNLTVIPTALFKDAVKNSDYKFYTILNYPDVYNKLGFPVLARGIHYGTTPVWPLKFNPFLEYFINDGNSGMKLSIPGPTASGKPWLLMNPAGRLSNENMIYFGINPKEYDDAIKLGLETLFDYDPHTETYKWIFDNRMLFSYDEAALLIDYLILKRPEDFGGLGRRLLRGQLDYLDFTAEDFYQWVTRPRLLALDAGLVDYPRSIFRAPGQYPLYPPNYRATVVPDMSPYTSDPSSAGGHHPTSGFNLIKSGEPNMENAAIHEIVSHGTDEMIPIVLRDFYNDTLDLLLRMTGERLAEGFTDWFELRATKNEILAELLRRGLNIDEVSDKELVDMLENINGYGNHYVELFGQYPDEPIKMMDGEEIVDIDGWAACLDALPYKDVTFKVGNIEGTVKGTHNEFLNRLRFMIKYLPAVIPALVGVGAAVQSNKKGGKLIPKKSNNFSHIFKHI